MGKHIVKLTIEERGNLVSLISKGKASARKLTHARILLEVDEAAGQSKTDEVIAQLLHTSIKTVQRVRTECVEKGIESALERKAHSRYKPRALEGEGEAHLLALYCSDPPEGRKRWTLRLLSDTLVCLDIVGSISPQTVSDTLKKMN